MLDKPIRHYIDPAMEKIASQLVQLGVRADFISFVGFAIGFCAFLAIFFHFFILALALILLSRLCDGLDGAVARQTKQTDYGGFLDIVLDFAFYGLIPLGFILSDIENNAFAGSILLLSFYVNGASFLTFALMMEKQNIKEINYGTKSIFYSTGLTEASETLAVFALFCLLPNYFWLFAFIFAVLVFYTTITRFLLAKQTFINKE